MSTTVTLSTAILCEYKTGTLGPYTLLSNHSRVTGKIYWTYKNNKISFYFKCTNREVQTYLDTTARVYKFFGSPAGYIRLGVNGSYTDYRFAVKQSSAGGIAGGSGWIEWDGNYDSTTTKTINATTSTVTLVIGYKASTEETKSVSFTPSKTTMVSTVPKVEYYRDGINVKARVICVTTRSSTTYSDSYTYVAKITVSGSSQQVTLSIPSTNTSTTSTSSWVTVASTANSLTASVSISSTNGGAYSATRSTTMNVPAMSTISGEATGTLGTDYIINITRYNADFTDTLSYYVKYAL